MGFLRKAALCGATTMLAAASAASAAAQDYELIKNGNFEQPHVPMRVVHPVSKDYGGQIPHWELVGGSVMVYGVGIADTSRQVLNLNGNFGPGIIAQTFSPPLGKKVTILWEHARNTTSDCPTEKTTDEKYTATVESTQTKHVVATGDYETGVIPGRLDPVTDGLTFTAKEYAYTLTFASRVPGACGALITGIHSVVGNP